MKNSILLIIAIFAFSTLANAQVDQNAIKKDIKGIKKEESSLKKEKRVERQELRKLTGKDINNMAKQQFQIDFPKVTDIQWKRTNVFDEASFSKDGKTWKAYYDFDSKLVGTSNIATFAELPSRAQTEINKRYRDYSKGPVIFFDDNEFNEADMILYGLQFEDEDNYFVELTKDTKKVVVRVNKAGDVFFFKELQK